MPITAAAILGGATLLGGAMTNSANKSIASDTNATSIELANTGMQRRVADLKAAGLNPVLAATGQGAQVPQLQVPTMQNAVAGGVGAGVSAFQSATQAKAVDTQVQVGQSQVSLNNAMSLKAAADADAATASAAEARARTGVYAPQIQEIMSRIDNIASQTGLNFAQTLKVKREAANVLTQGTLLQSQVALTDVQTGNALADKQLKALSYELGKYQIPGAQNQANAANSWVGRNIMPFVPSALGIAGTAAGFGSAVNSAFKGFASGRYGGN